MQKFYDTNILLELQEKCFEDFFVISSKTLEEIENIKVSNIKDESIKFKARNVSRLLNKFINNYNVIIVDDKILQIVLDFNMPLISDNVIVASAYFYNKEIEPIYFYSLDINCKIIANKIFKLPIMEDNIFETEYYKGYKKITLTQEELALFYENINNNMFNCNINEYIILDIKEVDSNFIYRWNGSCYMPIMNKGFKSKMFGSIKPLDDIQRCAFDSLFYNEITILYGKAGSGKTIIPLSYIMQNLETQKFKKFHIIHHYETLKGAKTLGFEKGCHTEKILNSGSLGNILGTKFGDIQIVEAMISTNLLNIIPTANIRGIEFGEEDVVYVTEAQNLDIYTLKTIIQRCKKGCRQIYEGDIMEQSDINTSQLGINRMIEVFKNNENFGCVKLKNNYRNPICELANKM